MNKFHFEARNRTKKGEDHPRNRYSRFAESLIKFIQMHNVSKRKHFVRTTNAYSILVVQK